MLFKVGEGFFVCIGDVVFHLYARCLNQTAVSEGNEETMFTLSTSTGLQAIPVEM